MIKFNENTRQESVETYALCNMEDWMCRENVYVKSFHLAFHTVD